MLRSAACTAHGAASPCSAPRWRSCSPGARWPAAPSAPSRRPTAEPTHAAGEAPSTARPPTRCAGSRRRRRPAPRRRRPELRRGRDGDARVPDRRRPRRDRARLRRRAHQAHAPDRRPARPDAASSTCTPSSAPTARWDDARCGSPTPAPTALFADFARDGEPHTLASDLRVDGAADLRALPGARAPRRRPTAATTCALEAADARPGEEADLRFTITQGRRARRDRALPRRRRPPRRAARGRPRLPARAPDQTRPARAEIGFAATFPTAGRYRLFLQFQHDGARPDRRLHAGGAVMRRRAPRAADHGHDLRVVREPDRAQAQHARRRHGDGQLRDRERDGRATTPPPSSPTQLVAAVEAAGYAGRRCPTPSRRAAPSREDETDAAAPAAARLAAR